MSALTLSIDIPPQERTRLCVVAAVDVCQRSGALVDAAAQYKAYDNAAAPYIRAVYVHCAGTVAAKRVAVASGSECGSHLREALRAATAGIKAPTVACWLTVTLEDTCTLQHAMFAISPDSRASPVLAQSDGAAHQQGTLHFSLLPTHAQGYATPYDEVYKSRDRTFSDPAPTPLLESAVADLPPPSPHSSTQRPQLHAQPPQQRTPSAQNPYRRIEQPQTNAVRDPASSTLRSPSLQKKKAARPHPSLNSAAAAPRIGGPDSSVFTPSHTSSTARPKTKPASPPPPNASADRAVHRPPPASQNPCLGSASPAKATELVVRHSLGAGLVVLSDGRQCGDRALRTRYAQRRKELWDIADAVMTHNYPHKTIGSNSELTEEHPRRPPAHR
ncbi:hypothetical protein JKF63_03700 [Porcisia hertigi]|uniref:Uncharacterized protein n=1 Tax=Porcisia hertigi TaxID=2761500 RepID=A0A836I087_9TRYP|nr:hypothetical protein JKF63_03700 [Porcisia hertigi]